MDLQLVIATLVSATFAQRKMDLNIGSVAGTLRDSERIFYEDGDAVIIKMIGSARGGD